MKITEMTHSSRGETIESKKSQVSFKEFSASLTPEEKSCPSFFDWSHDRLAALVNLYYLDHVQSYDSHLDRLKRANINLSHFMFSFGLSELNFHYDFKGSKENVQTEIFNLNMTLSENQVLTEQPVHNTSSAKMENETGQERPTYQKISSFCEEPEAANAILEQLKNQVNFKNSDLKTQKINEIELIHATAFLLYFADNMSVMAAETITHQISGLMNEKAGAEEQLRMDSTEVVFTGNMKTIPFNLTWQHTTDKPKLN